MGRFFIEGTPKEKITISGEDGRHIARSLRMQPGEAVTLCNGAGLDFFGEIEEIDGDSVTVKILSQKESVGEPSVFVTVYQGLPKSDKMERIIQKSGSRRKASRREAAALCP